jgi:hypothetical protein
MVRFFLPVAVAAGFALAGCLRAPVARPVEPTPVAIDVARSGERGVVVPKATIVALARAAGSAVIYVVRSGRAERRSVAVGEVSEETVEVLSGVVSGDEIICPGESSVRDGEPVRTVPRPQN